MRKRYDGGSQESSSAAQRNERVGDMKKFIIALVCVFTGVMAQDAFAAITFKRFPHCLEGPVTVKTCECHARYSRIWHYCHAGHYCHYDGSCTQ